MLVPHPLAPSLLQGSLRAALIRAYGGPFAVAGAIKLVHDCMAFLQPIILKQVLAHLDATKLGELATGSVGSSSGSGSGQAVWLDLHPRVVGLLWALALFTAAAA